MIRDNCIHIYSIGKKGKAGQFHLNDLMINYSYFFIFKAILG